MQRQHVAHVETRRRVLQRNQCGHERAGAGKQDERRGDLRHGEEAQAPVGTGGDAEAAAGKSEAVCGVGRGQARDKREEHGGGHRQTHAHPQQAGVHGQIERAHGKTRRVARQNIHHRPRQRDAEHGASSAQQQALRQQRPSQRGPAGAQRGADGQFALPAHRARQDQVRHIRTRDDEDEGGGRQQHQKNGPRGRRDLIAQPDGADLEAVLRRIGLFVTRHHGRVRRPQLRERCLHLDARSKAAEQLGHPVHPSVHHGCVQMVRARHDVGHDLRLRRIRHGRFEDPDDGGGAIAETDRLADHGCVSLQGAGPEPVRQHHCARGGRAIIVWTE